MRGFLSAALLKCFVLVGNIAGETGEVQCEVVVVERTSLPLSTHQSERLPFPQSPLGSSHGPEIYP